MEQMNKEQPKKLTVLLDQDLERRLNEERSRFELEQGVAISMNQIATRAIRDGLKAQQA